MIIARVYSEARAFFLNYIKSITHGYDLNTRRDNSGDFYIAIVANALSLNSRFLAVLQLLDIACVGKSKYTRAKNGIICSCKNDGSYSILFSRNKDEKFCPASLAKVVTLIAGNQYEDLNDFVEILPEDISDIEAFTAGDVVNVNDLIHGMLLASSNACALAYARYISEKLNHSIQFTELMNSIAKSIGMSDSYFDTPSGRSRTSYTTVKDMMLCFLHAMKIGAISSVWGKTEHDVVVVGRNQRVVHLKSTVYNRTLVRGGVHNFGRQDWLPSL